MGFNSGFKGLTEFNIRSFLCAVQNESWNVNGVNCRLDCSNQLIWSFKLCFSFSRQYNISLFKVRFTYDCCRGNSNFIKQCAQETFMARGNSYTEISVSSKATIVTFELNKQRKPTTKRPFLLNFDYKEMASYLQALHYYKKVIF